MGRANSNNDVNGNKSDHLQNHIHLTNCIHSKNHIHKKSPILGNRDLLRGFVALRRSRSLRDPSTIPRSKEKNSPSPSNRGKEDVFSEPRVRRVESSRMVLENDVNSNTSHLQEGNVLADSFEFRGKKKGVYRQSDQLEFIPTKSDHDAAFSCNHERKLAHMGRIAELEANNMKREKRRRFRSARRSWHAMSTREPETRHNLSVASNSFAEGRDPVGDYGDRNIDGNRCGIPWNWSMIHHRGKSFLDMAGQSLSCGLSESHLKKKGTISQGKGISNMSEHSSSSSLSEGDALPLLIDASGSPGSIDRRPVLHDYSGGLGVFSDNLLRQETHEQHTLQRQHTHRHQNLTQKYIPTTFRDLVGQNLVVQALTNAVMKRKIGLLYVFYGPHGTGKSTCARIFAKALTCQSLDSTKPCRNCGSCIAQAKEKSRNVRVVGPVSKIDLESVIELLHSMISSHHQTKYGVFIFDDCDALTSDCWSVILKVIDRAPRHVVFILVCSSLDVLPHAMISRCQKFLFNKLKDAEIIYTLQWIATKEDLEIDKDALKLIASSSNGSLRDAEMTLEQLSLLGQKISLSLVQDLVGLTSDDKLVELLDSALSADTINTVRILRDIMGSGIEPLTLMSQLATVITDILAGSYSNSTTGRLKMKFFEHQALSKEDMEKLRQALKTLSEAEKQLRVSNDKTTWLTAALLQMAPDQHYVLPRSSARSSMDHSPTALHHSVSRDRARRSNTTSQDGSPGDVYFHDKSKVIEKKRIEEIWLEVLEKISIKSLKEFMSQQGKLVSLSYGEAPTVHLMFNSQLSKSDVEKFRSHILHAFESVLKSPVTIEIRDGSSRDVAGTEASTSEYVCKNRGGVSRQGTISDERSESCVSLVRSKVSLGHVIQHAHKPTSIAEKVEQDNMRLEPRSRTLLCWNTPRITRSKVSGWKIKARKPQTVLKFVSCGRCPSTR